jgi:hypothetical protein
MKKQSLNIIVTCGSPTHVGIIEETFQHFSLNSSTAIFYDFQFKLSTKEAMTWLPYRDVIEAQYPCDWNTLTPLDETILEKMALCEVVTLRMMERSNQNNSWTYSRRKRAYLRHLRFWHNILQKKKIDLVLFMNIPHDVYDFVLYSLCKAAGIKTLCLYQGRVVDTVLLLEDWEKSLPSVEKKYRQLQKKYGKNQKSLHLEKRFLDQLYPVQKEKDFLPFYMKPGYLWQEQQHIIQIYFQEVIKKTISDPQFILTRIFSPVFWFRKLSFTMEERLLKKFYRSLTHQPDLRQKFIYFPLHFQPELTTSPLAGAYVEQLLMIEMISAFLPSDVYLYVKEHPRQTRLMRGRQYYKDIVSQKQVVLVPQEYSSKTLIENSLAVATGTGTAGWEALFLEKPVLMFGHDLYQFVDGVFRITSQKDCRFALQKVLQKKHRPKLRDVEIFLLALQETLIHGYIDENYQVFSSLEQSQNIRNISKAVVKYIKSVLREKEVL